MSETRHRLPKTLLVVAIVLAVLAAGGGWLAHILEREQWIVQTVDTQAMADARQLDGLRRISIKSLLPKKATESRCTLYSAILYPGVHTVICTVEKPKQFKEFAAYLISDEGTVYPGWYNPSSAGDASTEKFGIAKVAFENLLTNQIVRLDIVDQSEVSGTYTPDSSASRISFALTPPAREEPEDTSLDESEAADEVDTTSK